MTLDLSQMMDAASCMYATFQPRPDQKERFDEQTGFFNSKHKGVTFLIGGNGAGTTTLALAKAMKLVLQEQEAPRPATPFWIISEGYPMVMDTCFNEKLYARGLLPKEEIQWDKIDWYRPNQNWPYRVPLKPWPDGNQENFWVLEFKSYDQGRRKMQASSIGGFLFVEQCPFELITEVNRGCRDYNFPGSKLAEFTPVDPALSAKLESMIEEDAMPSGWEVYRANTLVAKEYGHVDEDWFNEFFGMISPEMLEVRMTGAFASYEGLIYPSLNPKIHFVNDMMIAKGCKHKRAIDWGSGPDHAFVNLWGAKDGVGTWWIYDEYYSIDQECTVIDHCENIVKQNPWDQSHPEYGVTYADPSRPDLMRLFARYGVATTGAFNEVMEGIERVRVNMKIQDGLGEPRLYIDRDRCPNLCRELRSYRWEKGTMNSMNPKDARPVPLKKDDHAVDALRYLIASDWQEGFGGVQANRIRPKNRWGRIHQTGQNPVPEQS